MLSLHEELELFKKYKENYSVMDKNTIIIYIRDHLNKLDNTYGKQRKMDLVRQLFSLLIVNKNFVFNEGNFKKCVHDKINEMYNDHKWEAMSEIYNFYLFGETLSGKKYNFENKINYYCDNDDKFEKLFDEIKNIK